LSAPYAVQPQAAPFDGPPVKVPGSKSITNRALMVAALAEGRTVLRGALFSDDSKWMAESLRRLGVNVLEDPIAEAMAVDGCDGSLPSRVDVEEPLFVGMAGTAARFLPCLAALGRDVTRFDAEPRMRERPMHALLEALKGQGAELQPFEKGGPVPQGYPFSLRGHGLKGGPVSVDVSHSTQFASGLLMAAPYAKSPLTLVVEGDRQQIPYVDMSAAVMGQFGVAVRREGSAFPVPQGRYKSPGDYLIEPDLSAAAYFFAATTLVGGKVTVLGTQAQAMQGDIRFLKVLQHLGASFYQDEHGLTLEKDPSTPLTVKNVAHIREQECDRIHAAVENLKLLGIQAEEQADGFTVHPGAPKGASLPTYGDHRVAMAFSLVGLKVPGVSIQDPACVAKTFADYWHTLEAFQAGRQHA
jgi:3-phosphoshikimate 1-carboxyvinyltransferase